MTACEYLQGAHELWAHLGRALRWLRRLRGVTTAGERCCRTGCNPLCLLLGFPLRVLPLQALQLRL